MRLFAPSQKLPFPELVLLLAALMSTMAFSIDSVMPALPELAATFRPDAPSRAQLVISVFLIGAGAGMLIFGPMADSIGRRRTLTAGATLYAAASLIGMFATSLEMLLAARLVQGMGASAARITAQATTRDMFSGREQARVASITFLFFLMVPAAAPLIGQWITHLTGWRGLFGAYLLMISAVWFWFQNRQPETLLPANRRPYRPAKIRQAMGEVLRQPIARRYLMVNTLGLGQLMAFISSAQQIFTDHLGLGDRFPLYFALIALTSGASALLNARLVMRLGMRPLAIFAYGTQIGLASLYWIAMQTGLVALLPQGAQIWLFVAWAISLFLMNGLTFGNLNALSMEPLGHIAGTAAAVIGAFSTGFSVLIAIPIGQAFDGTPMPLVGGVALCSAAGFLLIWTDRKRMRG
ncbi:MAG: multidrug MFS transporter [Rhodobacterales bacterium]|nr:MAG: multidrug MFS transporter [Rhodobacterales bacterium]